MYITYVAIYNAVQNYITLLNNYSECISCISGPILDTLNCKNISKLCPACISNLLNIIISCTPIWVIFQNLVTITVEVLKLVHSQFLDIFGE